MKAFKIIIILLFFIFCNCTDTGSGGDLVRKDFINRITNNTNNTFTFITKNKADVIVNVEVIEPNEFLDFCEYKSQNFIGIACDDLWKIEIMFNSNKGYICSILGDNNLCIPNKKLLEDRVGTNIGNNIYEIVITQEDYEKAFDLP